MPDVGTPFDLQTPNPPESQAQIDSQQDLFLRSRDVLGLEELYLRRLLDGAPDSKQFIFGGGALPEVTLIGNVQERFAGAAILNYSAAPLSIGFAASAGLFTGYVVNPGMWMVIPENYTDLSVAVPISFAAGVALNPVTIVRTFVPPAALNCGLLVAPNVPVADTVTAANTTTAPAAGTILVQTPVLAAGVYEAVCYSGVQSGALLLDVKNVELVNGGVVVGPLLSADSSTQTPIASTFPRITVAAGAVLALQAIANATAGTQYLQAIQATRVL
jgi:hypothetical protein